MTIPSGPSFGRGAGAASTSFWTISHTFRNISQRDATPRAPDDRGRRTSWILIGVAIRCCDRFTSSGLSGSPGSSLTTRRPSVRAPGCSIWRPDAGSPRSRRRSRARPQSRTRSTRWPAPRSRSTPSSMVLQLQLKLLNIILVPFLTHSFLTHCSRPSPHAPCDLLY